MKNDSSLQIRLNSRLRAEFIGRCRLRERTAAQVLREFIKEYVDENQSDQHDMFDDPSNRHTDASR